MNLQQHGCRCGALERHGKTGPDQQCMLLPSGLRYPHLKLMHFTGGHATASVAEISRLNKGVGIVRDYAVYLRGIAGSIVHAARTAGIDASSIRSTAAKGPSGQQKNNVNWFQRLSLVGAFWALTNPACQRPRCGSAE